MFSRPIDDFKHRIFRLQIVFKREFWAILVEDSKLFFYNFLNLKSSSWLPSKDFFKIKKSLFGSHGLLLRVKKWEMSEILIKKKFFW